jgi:hypothetical protein
MANLFNVLDHEVSDDVIGKIGAYLNEPPEDQRRAGESQPGHPVRPTRRR